MFLQVFVCAQGEGRYPSMHCRWYPSMPCSRSLGSIPAFLAGFQAHTQGGSLGGSGWGVCLLWGGGCLLPRDLLQGVCSQVGGWRPPMMATATGGTHPTGMHFCLVNSSRLRVYLKSESESDFFL